MAISKEVGKNHRRDKGGYYDCGEIDVEQMLMDNGLVEEMMYLRDLRQRKLFIGEDIDQISVGRVTKHIMQYNAEDSGIDPKDRKPILLYLNSNGGEVDAGFELIDTILMSQTPVYTINTGYWYSMGFLIGIAGHKRFATKHAKFLMHDGSQFVFNSSSKLQDQMEFQMKIENSVKEYTLEHSKVTSEQYDEKRRVEWYMFSSEAKELGFIDCIIGEDCDINEVV